MEKNNYCYELCPQCDSEVKLDYEFEVQQCPNCQCPILPCSICNHDEDNRQEFYGSCDTCPLDEILKDAWIDKIMQTAYADDNSGKYYASNVRYLQTINTFKLSMMYQDWNHTDSEDE